MTRSSFFLPSSKKFHNPTDLNYCIYVQENKTMNRYFMYVKLENKNCGFRVGKFNSPIYVAFYFIAPLFMPPWVF